MEQQQENVGLGQYLKSVFQQGLQLLKNPVKLLPTLAIGFVWLVIGILSSLWKPFPWPMQFLSFLSYAEGGLFGGVLGAVGGIVGKVVVAVFINSAILPLFEKKPPFVGVAGGVKGMFTSMQKDALNGVAPLVQGVGLALLLYTFMNINQRWQNSMVGIVSLVMLLQAMGSKSSFLMGLIFSAARSITKGKVPTFLSVTRFLTGMTIGFTMAVGLSLVGLHWCFWLALFFLFLSLVLGLLMKAFRQQPAVAATPPPFPGVPPTQGMPPTYMTPPPYGAPPTPGAPTGQVPPPFSPPPYYPQR